MKLCLDPYDVAPRDVTAESLALAGWYDSQPAIRRLWGIREAQTLRVIIADLYWRDATLSLPNEVL